MEHPAKRQRLSIDTAPFRRQQDGQKRDDRRRKTLLEKLGVAQVPSVEADKSWVGTDKPHNQPSPLPTTLAKRLTRRSNEPTLLERRQAAASADGLSTSLSLELTPSSVAVSAASAVSVDSVATVTVVDSFIADPAASTTFEATETLSTSATAAVDPQKIQAPALVTASVSVDTSLPTVPTVPAVPPFPSTLTVPAVPSFPYPSGTPTVIVASAGSTSTGAVGSSATAAGSSSQIVFSTSPPPTPSPSGSSSPPSTPPPPSSASNSTLSSRPTLTATTFPAGDNLTTSVFTSTGLSTTITGSTTIDLGPYTTLPQSSASTRDSSSSTPSTLLTSTSASTPASSSQGGLGGIGGGSPATTTAGAPSSSSTAPPITNDSTSVPTPAVVGGVVGGLAGVALILAIILILLRRWKRSHFVAAHQPLPGEDSFPPSRGGPPALPGRGAATTLDAEGGDLGQGVQMSSRNSILPLAAAAGLFWNRVNRFSSGSGASTLGRPTSTGPAPRGFERVPGTGRKLASPYSPGLGPGGLPEMSENPFGDPTTTTRDFAAAGVGSGAGAAAGGMPRNLSIQAPAHDLPTGTVRPSPARTPTVQQAGPYTPVTPSSRGENRFFGGASADRSSGSTGPRGRDSQTLPSRRDTLETRASQYTTTTTSEPPRTLSPPPSARGLTLGRSHTDASRGSRFTEEMS